MKTERKQSRREKVPGKKPGFNGAGRASSPDLRASGRPSSWGSCNLKLNPELLNVFRPALCISPGRVTDRKAGSVLLWRSEKKEKSKAHPASRMRL